MTSTYLRADKAGPLWAVFGAPLVGVPLMVALLALGAQPGTDAAVEADLGFGVEQADMPETAQEPELDAASRD